MINKRLIYLIGLPGSGKSTISYLLYKKLKCCHIISSQSILKLVSNSSATYLRSNYINRGINIPDDLYVDLIKKEIEKTKEDIIIIEGFPYNLNQINLSEKVLKETNSQLSLVVLLEEKEEVLYERLKKRKVCPKCNKSFNSDVEICMNCNSILIKRKDDELEIIKKRIENQKTDLIKVVKYYEKTDKLIKLKVLFTEKNEDIDIISKKLNKSI